MLNAHEEYLNSMKIKLLLYHKSFLNLQGE